MKRHSLKARAIKIDGFGWLTVAALTLNAVWPTIIALYLANAKVPGSVSALQWVTLPAGGGLIAFIIAVSREWKSRRYSYLERLERAVEKADFPSLIDGALRSIVDKKNDRSANIMIIDSSGKVPVMRIRHRYSISAQPDMGVTWEKHEGCCGKAWGFNNQITVDLNGKSEAEMRDDWRMTPSQIACTRNLGSVISAPLRNVTNIQEVVGVLNCDSTLPLDKSGFADENFADHFEQHAWIISGLIHVLREVEDDYTH